VRGLSPVPRYEPAAASEEPYAAAPVDRRGSRDVFVWEDLRPGATVAGPAVLESATNSCTIPAGWRVRIDGFSNALLERADQEG
jgi:N-methylhydantoinase A/oxoprolinase/acetone carboxylase beta subunit